MSPTPPFSPPRQRRTLAAPAEVRGVTLFTGVQARATIRPAAPGSGIAFARVDLPGTAPIPARFDHVMPEARRTVLAASPTERGSPSVQTVEHILSALAGLGVTDALVEVHGPEVPIGDGSAAPFVEAILAAGIADAGGAPPEPIVIRETITIEDATGGRVVAEPSEIPGLELVYHLDYGPNAPMPSQVACFLCGPGATDEYATRIAPARTFSTLDEALAMRKLGLFGHLTAREMLVIGPDGPVENAYRFADEPARHKLLDMLGDLVLTGRPIQGRVTAWRSGHALNHAMARRLAGL